MGLLNLRNALMAGKRLPYDAEVEYLQSSGTQYINTGIKPGPNTRVEITFAMTTFTANCGLFGARGNATADNNSYNLFIISNNGSRVRWDWSGSGQYQTSEAETSTDATYVLGAAGGNITRNGTTVMSVSASKAAINYPLYVFNFNNVGTPYSTGANARVWSVKIYDGQTLVFDAIPVRKKTVGYLYDRVSGKLFGNAGTGDFVVGPDIVPVEYIESHGTEYIAMGIAGNALSRIDIGIEKTEANGTRRFVICSNRDPNASIGSSTYFDVNTSGYFGQNTNGFACTVGQWYNLSIRADGYYSDGVKVYSPYFVFPLRPSVELCLLSAGTATGGRWVGRISYLKAWDTNGIPVRNLSPVRVGTDATSWKGAMMDVLTRRIYRNAGTGAFTYGNDLKYPIPA